MLASVDRHSVAALDISLQHSLHPFTLPAPQQLPWSPSAACSWLEPLLDCWQLHRWGAEPHCRSCSAYTSGAGLLVLGQQQHTPSAGRQPTACGLPAAGGTWPPSSGGGRASTHRRRRAGEHGACPVCAAALASAGIQLACHTVRPGCMPLAESPAAQPLRLPPETCFRHTRSSLCGEHSAPLPQVQETVQGDVGGLMGAVTGITGGVAGISRRHLLAEAPPTVLAELEGAVTDAGNTALGGVDAGLTTLELLPPPAPPSR